MHTSCFSEPYVLKFKITDKNLYCCSFLLELFERELCVCNALYWESFDPLLLLYADPLELLREYAEPLELLRLLSVESGLFSCLGL